MGSGASATQSKGETSLNGQQSLVINQCDKKDISDAESMRLPRLGLSREGHTEEQCRDDKNFFRSRSDGSLSNCDQYRRKDSFLEGMDMPKPSLNRDKLSTSPGRPENTPSSYQRSYMISTFKDCFLEAMDGPMASQARHASKSLRHRRRAYPQGKKLEPLREGLKTSIQVELASDIADQSSRKQHLNPPTHKPKRRHHSETRSGVGRQHACRMGNVASLVA